MSVFDRIMGKGGGRSIPSGAVFRLTESGRDKLQEFGGDPKSLVLVALETRGTSSVEEISLASGVKRGQVERLIPTMVKAGYIQYVSSTSGGGEE
jgi:hypothetical protein